MSQSIPTTRYFAVGFFTTAQSDARDRALLQSAATGGVVPSQQSAIRSVAITVWKVATASDIVELAMNKVSTALPDAATQAAGGSFAIERFASTFPGKATPQAAFQQYLASPEGIATFGKATAVQLIAVDIDKTNDPNEVQSP